MEKYLSKNLFEGGKNQNKNTSQKCLHRGKFKIHQANTKYKPVCCFCASRLNPPHVAMVATHQLQTADEQEYSQRAQRKKKVSMTYSILYSGRGAKNTNFCFARVQLQLLENDYYPNAVALG